MKKITLKDENELKKLEILEDEHTILILDFDFLSSINIAYLQTMHDSLDDQLWKLELHVNDYVKDILELVWITAIIETKLTLK